MRKEGDILRHVAHVTSMRWQIGPFGAREHDPIADGNASGGRATQPGDSY